jgi:hypothetical protein
VGPDGTLCDESGARLPRGLKLVEGDVIIAASGTKLPKSKHLGSSHQIHQCVQVTMWGSAMLCFS